MQLKFELNDFVDEAVDLLPRILRVVSRDDQFRSKNFELTVPQLRVLRVLFDEGEMNMRSLSKALQVAPPSTTITVDRLVSQGLVTRKEDKTDRRLVLVDVSAKGKSVMTKFINAKKMRWREIMGSLSQEERHQVILTLRQLYSLLQKGEGSETHPDEQNS